MSDRETREFKKFDTYATYTALVKLLGDPKVFVRDDKGEDVVLVFKDSSRFEGMEDLWIDARVHRGVSEWAKRYRKGDQVLISGKLRFKRQPDGTMRGKIYDANVNSFVPLSEREEMGPQEPRDTPTFE